MSLFAELKRRNVFRVAIAYVVGGWLLLQLTDVLVELLDLPDVIGRVVVLVVAIGLPVALFFAWAFELTPEGIKREHEVDRTQSITPQTGRKLDFWIIGVLVIALSYFVFDKFIIQEQSQPAAEVAELAQQAAPMETSHAEPSIAVLPFVNMSADEDQVYFSDGISEELLNLLVRVDGLKVASRTSSFSYRGANRNIPQIAQELKVEHILEGSVRKAGNRVRITAQLIDTGSDRHLWSDTFDRELDDIFAIQDEIANAIVNALKSELGIGLAAVTVETATENLDAYDLYLKARSLFTARQNLPVAAQLFKQAIELDPGYARAWEGLAGTYSVSSSWLGDDGNDYATLAREAADKALEIDPGLSLPYAVLAMIPNDAADGFTQAIANLDIALKNDPKNTTAWLWRGIQHKDLGHFEKAVNDITRCVEIDAGYMNCRQHLAEAYLFWGKPEKAIPLLETTIEANFHSTSGSFVSHYLRSGERITALLLGSMAMNRQAPYGPVNVWVEALENPNEEQSARVEKYLAWGRENNIRLNDLGVVIPALGLFDYIDPATDARPVWHPDSASWRQTEDFRSLARRYFLRAWQEIGFPPQCRQLEGEDFECD